MTIMGVAEPQPCSDSRNNALINANEDLAGVEGPLPGE